MLSSYQAVGAKIMALHAKLGMQIQHVENRECASEQFNHMNDFWVL